MASRQPVVRRKLRSMLDDYLRANNIEPVRPRVPLTRHSGRTDARSRQRTPVPVTPRAPTEEPTNPDSVPGDGPTFSPPMSESEAFHDEDIERPDDFNHEPPVSNEVGPQEPVQPDPLERHDTEAVTLIRLPDLQTTQAFIEMLHVAVLENSGMDPEDIENLRNPEPALDLLDPSPLLRSMRHFINNTGSSRDHYDNLRAIELLNNPTKDFLSFDQVKRRVRHLSGVVPLEKDMCPESCIAYTGPYGELDKCPRCYTTRYFPDSHKPRKRFATVPIGPVIQAFYGSREVADHMHYLERKLAENTEKARLNEGKLSMYDDTACGKDLLDAWNAGRFGKHDVALQLSIDGAQLRPDQPSEAWVFIWVIHNLPPDMRYKKVFVIPAAIVPGPKKPGDIDSFLFPSLYHLAALQREGLRVYDTFLGNIVPRCIPMLVFATADSPGSASMSGMVGHGGKYGCRLYCEMPSRRRDGDSHYYPAMNCPDNYSVLGCCHPDVTVLDLHAYRSGLPRKYKENLDYLLAASTLTEYRSRRLAVGLCKQALFSGLPVQPVPVPHIFTMDIMHLSVLNDPDLFVKLFTGKLDCYEPDDRSTWDWAVFYKNQDLWSAHGETVARAVPYIPSSFGRAPRDPAKKINSGYKAWEFQQYMYGLGPTLFRHILPRQYWLNFCKLVSGIRILQRHRISHPDLLKGHALLQDFAQEFENLYYRRMESRIHFVRHSVHLLTHLAPETLRAGPLACYAQWTLETAIGNLGREIRQDRDLFANLTQRAILRAQVNSLQARYPRIKIEIHSRGGSSQPNNACVFEAAPGYAFLPRCEEYPEPLSDDELNALMVYWGRQGWPNQHSWPNAVCRWAKLSLPNGQRARSIWHESRSAIKMRRTSCVELVYNNHLRIANVLFYFYLRFGDAQHPLAMLTLFSMPDAEILADSSDTVYLCDPLEGPEGLVVAPVTAICSVVSMFPDMAVNPESATISPTGKFSLMRHAYIELSTYASDGLFEADYDNL